MASATSDKKGFVTQETINHYSRLMKANPGIAMAEYTYVHESGKSEPNQMGVYCEENIKGLSEIASLFNQNGSLSILQLAHGGGKSSTDLTGGRLLAPSQVRVPVKNHTLELPDKATQKDIKSIKNAFIQGASRAERAGFKGIELHSAHGYGLNQWLSPLTNKRKDLYGGNVYNRAKLLFEIVSEIRKNQKDKVISVRVPGKDHITDGIQSKEMILICQHLEKLGVDIINVSSGLGGWRRPQGRKGEGYLVQDASVIQQHVNIPVIGVGGIQSSEYIDRTLENNKVSFVAIGRTILNDPNWGKRLNLSTA